MSIQVAAAKKSKKTYVRRLQLAPESHQVDDVANFALRASQEPAAEAYTSHNNQAENKPVAWTAIWE